jgi:hypothetical protein
MSFGRTVFSLLAVLTLAAAGQAQTYTLAEDPLVDSYFKVELDMKLTGAIKVRQERANPDPKNPYEQRTVYQTVTAKHQFLERVLEASKSGLVDKSARKYLIARAEFQVGKDRATNTLHPKRCFMIAHRFKDQAFVYCPDGILTREELELTEHFDTMGLPGLLPARAVKVGETWKPANAAVQTLLDLDGLVSQDLICKLGKVEKDMAEVSVTGTANGISLGAAVKMKVAGSYQFNLKAKHLTALTWKQNDEREQGPVSPAFQAEIVTTMKRTPIEAEEADDLDDVRLIKVEPTPPKPLTQLMFAEPQGRYELVYERDWHIVGRSENQLVMRLMDRGDFVAQLTVTPWKKAEPGKHIGEEEFKEAMSKTLGWEVEDTPEKGKVVPDPRAGYWIYQFSASGTLNGTKAVQYFYMVAGPQGDQVLLTFTMSPTQAAKLNTRDLPLVRGLSFPQASPAREQRK